MTGRNASPWAMGLACGWVADMLLGDPATRHPVAAFGRTAERLEGALWRPSRAAGVVYVLVLVAPLGVAAGVADVALRRRRMARYVLMAIITWTTLGGRSLARHAQLLAGAVEQGDLAAARRYAPALVGRDPTELDKSELCRAAVESVAENTADAVVGPLLWGALVGPGGAVAYRASNTLDAMVGHRNERYAHFGWAAARLDDLLTWPVARISSVLSFVLAPLVGGDARGALKTLVRDGGNHPSPNAGRLEAVFAGAFGVRLGGRNRYGDSFEDRPTIGDGAQPTPEKVRRAAALSLLVGGAAALLCSLLAARRDR